MTFNIHTRHLLCLIGFSASLFGCSSATDLTLEITAGGSVTIEKESTGSCGDLCNSYSGSVPLVAIPESGYQFKGWSGDCSGIEVECKVGTGVKSVTAHFESVEPDKPVIGKSYFGSENYVEYIRGNMPLVLSVPHGGKTSPSNMQTRSWGIKGEDLGTLELAYAIQNEMKVQGRYPHIIINHLQRKYVDANRPEQALELSIDGTMVTLESGADPADAKPLLALQEYNQFIAFAIDTAEAENGQAFLIDLHSHGHELTGNSIASINAPTEVQQARRDLHARVELGYQLGRLDIALDDASLNALPYNDFGGLANLANNSTDTLADLIRGDNLSQSHLSLGTLLEDNSIPAVPSGESPQLTEITVNYDDNGEEKSTVLVENYFPCSYTVHSHVVTTSAAANGLIMEVNISKINNIDWDGLWNLTVFDLLNPDINRWITSEVSDEVAANFSNSMIDFVEQLPPMVQVLPANDVTDFNSNCLK